MHNYKQSGKVENSQSYIVQLILEVRIIYCLCRSNMQGTAKP